MSFLAGMFGGAGAAGAGAGAGASTAGAAAAETGAMSGTGAAALGGASPYLNALAGSSPEMGKAMNIYNSISQMKGNTGPGTPGASSPTTPLMGMLAGGGNVGVNHAAGQPMAIPQGPRVQQQQPLMAQPAQQQQQSPLLQAMLTRYGA